jgi:predicted RNA-binding Zn-ribbon protein involved in translation (DUF1610 family)
MQKSGKVFYPRYDLAADDSWVLTYGQKELPAGQKAAGAGGPGIKISKRGKGPQYECPWCGNTDFVRCGQCGKITCNESGSESFVCAHCGIRGKIIGTLSGDDVKGMAKSSGSGQ